MSCLWELLDIQPGITAIIGSGGKTGLMLRLAAQLPGTVIICTSTHIFPPAELPTVEGTLDSLPCAKLCVGTAAPGGKLTAPADSFEKLASLADYVLVEADGSRHLPLKAHGIDEPVIPAGAHQVIQVVGLTGLGQPVETAVHRPAVFCALTGAERCDLVTIEQVATVLRKENLCDRVFLNQADTPALRQQGERLSVLLPWPTVIGQHSGETVFVPRQ